MGKIDDTLQQAQRLERHCEHEAARELADNDIEERYAVAATNVAAQEHAVAEAANKKVPNAVAPTEIRRLVLAWRRSELQIEKAQHDRKVNKMTAGAKSARVQEIDAQIDHRQVKAPISGMVVEIIKHRGEWVQAGDTILKMVRLDRLRVKGYLKAADYTTSDVVGRPVTVEVTLARGRKVEVPGKIVFVSPLVEGDEFAVWAEIVNKQEGDHWALSSGLSCEMTIHTGALASQPPSGPLKTLEPMRR
jgi:multidrug resistance efflux pump